MNLEFCPKRHEYYNDGIKIPSVSEIVKIFQVAKTGKLPYFPPGAANEGNSVHEFCKRCLEKRGYLGAAKGAANAWAMVSQKVDQVFTQFSIVPGSDELHIEKPIGCEYLAGTPDLVINRPDEIIVIDWKYAEPSISHTYQMIGYGILVEESREIKKENIKLFLVYLKNQLQIKKIEFSLGRSNYFLDALSIINYVKGEKI